ncbi:MAG: hypothetical protein ACOYBL_09770 [Lachnospiraceae bacterium]|jgi:hypothetical protein
MPHKVRVEYTRADGTPTDPAVLRKVTGRVEGGPGEFTGSGEYEVGGQADLAWTVPSGYEVASVTVKVNGAQRNDIVPVGTALTLTDIQDEYDITVTLKKSGGGSTTPDPDEDPAQPTWSVVTMITNGEGEITPTQHELANGSNWRVEWDFDTSLFTIKEVRIDGATNDGYLNRKRVDFENLSADHTVEIILIAKDAPDAPSGDIKEKYVISTERTQGGTIDQSAVVEKDADHTVHWEADTGYYVASVKVDGTKRDDLLDKGSVEFRNIGRDHHVAVVFAKEGEQKPNIKDMNSITANIGSGEGFVDGTLKVPDGADHTVTWEAADGWTVQTVIVDGQVRDDLKDAGRTEFKDIREDHTVTVLFQQKKAEDENTKGTFQIQTSREGKGTISPSARVNKESQYTVSWAPAKGYRVGRVEIDGVSCPELLDKREVIFKNIASEHTINVVFEREDGTIVPMDKIVHVTTGVTGGLGQITGNFTAEKGEEVVVEWKADPGYVVGMVYVNGAERPDLVSGTEGSFTWKDIQEDAKVEVLFVEEGTILPVDLDVDKTSNNGPKSGVNTGDSMQAGKYFAFAALSFAGMVILCCHMLRARRKNR